MSNKLITVFTPTFNRGYCLENLYKSLLKQSSYDFLWYIVDDGSTDNTKEIIQKFITENLIPIIYIYQKNAGKHVAHNNAVEKCLTELFICVDSDDLLTVDAINDIRESWRQLSDLEKQTSSGIVAYKGFMKGDIVGSEFPYRIRFSSLTDIYKSGKTGDTALIFRTDVIKKYPFPVFKNESFIRENLAYDLVDEKYQLLILRKVVYLCEYLPDGLSRNATILEMRSPKGAALYRLEQAKRSVSFKSYIRNIAGFLLFSIKAKDFKRIKSEMTNLQILLFFPLALVGAVRYMVIIKRKKYEI